MQDFDQTFSNIFRGATPEAGRKPPATAPYHISANVFRFPIFSTLRRHRLPDGIVHERGVNL